MVLQLKKMGMVCCVHSCANYMSEMDGKISVNSDGENKGATFTLMFKLDNV